ncbi:ATP-binding protein [Pseudoalteromonas shioyasakiensis]|uniref:ATP-binding protein n=1 Tax=Pseudoalteromonas shioyasakiensis TaxID=1190813 RepID=UPI00211887FB|nr:ATP-binding protein [Pseudoalteromonas shioyasakiensis]MCQ8877683.1 ATP-binding protein [Pseudoalteromonas shioyasakiensis]
MYFTIAHKILLIIGFTITLVLGASTTLHVIELKNQNLLNMSEKATAIVSPMLSEIEQLTQDGNKGSWVLKIQAIAIDELLDENTFNDLTNIYFVDNNAKIVTHINTALLATQLIDEQLIQASQNNSRTILNKKNLYNVVIPVKNHNKEKIGSVIVSFSDNDLAKKIKLIITNAILLFVVYLVAALAIAYIVIRKIILQPIDQLVEFSHAITTGDLDCPINISNQDEIGTLASGFKMMRAAIRQQINNMHQQQAALEDMVAQRTQEYLAAKEQAENSNKAKSVFLANMSHELRTPLNAVLGFSQLLQDREIEATKLRYLEAITVSGKSLLNILNDILDLSKIDAGKMHLELSNVELQQMCKELSLMFMQQCAQKDLALKIECTPDASKALLLDCNKLRQVMINLLSNAIKFTEQGIVSAQFDCKVSDTGEHVNLIIRVKDTGKGIAEDQQQIIFNAFEQVEGQKTSQYGGTGLGLAITLKFIKLMAGTISLNSVENQGSEFIIEIPDIAYAESQSNTNHINFPAISSYNFEPSKILIVDDITYNRDFLVSFLSRWPFAIDVAENGKIALQKVAKCQPDLIIMDMKMPVMGGLEATKQLRNNEQYKHIPIIAVTASALKNENLEFTQLTDYCITKPICREHLIFAIAQLIEPSK